MAKRPRKEIASRRMLTFLATWWLVALALGVWIIADGDTSAWRWIVVSIAAASAVMTWERVWHYPRPVRAPRPRPTPR